MTQPARNLKIGGTSGWNKESRDFRMTDDRMVVTEEQARQLLDHPAPDEELKRLMLRALAQTTDGRTRNVMALKLAEIGATEAVPMLTRLLYEPDTKGNRGTLLYALDELGAKLDPKYLLHLMMHDTYEVQTQAFDMLENTVSDMTPRDLRGMLDIVLDSAPGLDPEHREAAEVASGLLLSTFIARSPSPARPS
jgi:hypothetical protein